MLLKMWKIVFTTLFLSTLGRANPFQPASSNTSCQVIESSLFYIDPQCLENLVPSSSIHNSTSPTSELCTNQNQCQYDIFFWNQSQTCIAMSADALKSCPLLHDGSSGGRKSSLFFTVSQKMPLVVKQELIAKGYKYKIAELLDCNANKFLCDDLECIDWKQRCDKIPQCKDESDEFGCPDREKCLGRDGKYYSIGEEYAPHTESDVCKICVCGANSEAAYCYSPRCSAHLSGCAGSSPSICCKCFEDSYLKTSTSILGYSQRLLVSCLSVLFLISLLLILSRGFTQQALRRQANHRMTQSNWLAMNSRDLPPNRSFFETNTVRPSNVDFFERQDSDGPPPYPFSKSPEVEDVTEMPPTYEASAFHPAHPDNEDRVNTPPQPDSGAEPPSPGIEPGPTSPISTTSDCPLLRSDSTSRRS